MTRAAGASGTPQLQLATVDNYHHGYRRRDRMDEWAHELLAFRLGREEYALDILRIREILKPREVTEVPRAPTFVLGVVAVRGQVIPVVDLRLRLRLPAGPPTRESRILIVTKGEERYGVLVDGVQQVVRLRDEDVEPPPRTLGAHDLEFLLGIGRPKSDRMLILLQLDAVLTFPVGPRPGERVGAR